jgi:hypothetical protein
VFCLAKGVGVWDDSGKPFLYVYVYVHEYAYIYMHMYAKYIHLAVLEFESGIPAVEAGSLLFDLLY